MISIRTALALVVCVLSAAGAAPAVLAASAPAAQVAFEDCGCRHPVDPSRLIHATATSDGKTVLFSDGLPYMAARLGAAAVGDPPAYTMSALAKLALAQHAGLAVYDPAVSQGRLVWRFSLGAVSLIARDAWVRRVSGPPAVPLPGDRVVVRTPNANELPAELRVAIDRYMREHDGVSTPKVALVSIASSSATAAGTVMLVPNLSPAAFASESAWRRAVYRLEWFVPGNERLELPPADPERFQKTFHDVAPVAQTAE